MNTRQKLANDLAAAFEIRQRPGGESYTCLKEGAPGWVKDAVHDAHGDMMPDDWRYKAIREAASSLIGYEPDAWEESMHEIADGLVDVYTGALTAWLASRVSRVGYCDDAAEDFGPAASMEKALQYGQYAEYLEIIGSLITSINDQAEGES